MIWLILFLNHPEIFMVLLIEMCINMNSIRHTSFNVLSDIGYIQTSRREEFIYNATDKWIAFILPLFIKDLERYRIGRL